MRFLVQSGVPVFPAKSQCFLRIVHFKILFRFAFICVETSDSWFSYSKVLKLLNICEKYYSYKI